MYLCGLRCIYIKMDIYKWIKHPLQNMRKSHAGSSISEAMGSRNEFPAMELAVSSHPSGSKSWRLEFGAWMLELGNWKFEPRSQKSESGSWKLESGAPEPFGRSDAGPRSRSQVNVARGTCGPNILID